MDDSSSSIPESPGSDQVRTRAAQLLRGRSITRKTGIIIALSLLLLLVVVVSAVLLSVTNVTSPSVDSSVDSGKFAQQTTPSIDDVTTITGGYGDDVTTIGGNYGDDVTTTGGNNDDDVTEISLDKMVRIVMDIDEALSRPEETKRLILESQEASGGNDTLTKLITRSAKAVGLIDDLDEEGDQGREKVRKVRDILKAVLDSATKAPPAFMALKANKSDKMGPEDIFDHPLDKTFRTWNETEAGEILRSPNFQQRLKTFLELTDGMADGTMHVEPTGSEVGEEFSDEMDPEKVEQGIERLLDIQDTLINMTQTFEAALQANQTLLDAAAKAAAIAGNLTESDYDALESTWEAEVAGRKEFGFLQLQSELETMNKVNFTEKRFNQTAANILRLKLLNDRLANSVLLRRRPAGRMSSGQTSADDNDDDREQPFFLSGRAVCDPETELECKDGLTCYFKSERCDRNIHCADNSDEMDCECKDYLPAAKICDGFEDCMDGQDEVDCKCPTGMFYCGPQKNDDEFRSSEKVLPVCINSDLRCDNVYDCESQADESFCHELSPDVKKSPDITDPRSKGIVHVRTPDQGWKILSLETVESSAGTGNRTSQELQDYLQGLADDICQTALTITSMHAKVSIKSNPLQYKEVAHLRLNLDANVGRGEEPVRLGGRYSFHVSPPHPDSIIVEVDCGLPDCGMKSDLRAPEPSPALIASQGGSPQEVGIRNRIVGGELSTFAGWPFVVGLTRDGKFICGATILDRFWVLTAGHCLQDFVAKESHFQVIAGLHRRFSRSAIEQVRVVERIRIHSDYNSTWYMNDIALAKMDRPFDFNYAVSPICLPDTEVCSNGFSVGGDEDNNNFGGFNFGSKDSVDVMAPAPGARCVATGWGKTEEGGLESDELREVVIPVLSECKKSWNDIQNQICGGYKEGGKDSCQGDSGGPLFCQHPDRPSSWYLGGIISHGIGCARPDRAGVYIRVCAYTDWIKRTMQEETVDIMTTELVRSQPFFSNPVCPTWTCDGGKCIDKDEICNLFVSCFDRRDEMFCITDQHGRRVVDPNANPHAPTTPATTQAPPTIDLKATTPKRGSIHEIHGGEMACPAGQFRCKKIFQCVDASERCNAKPACMDMSDELQCSCREYLQTNNANWICNGHPDCHDGSDEVGCKYCGEDSDNMFYCHLSKTCIPKTAVCDAKYDCEKREDERYCANVVNGERVRVGLNGKPVQFNKGLLAINTKGSWRAVCAERWDKHINDRICRYMGKRESESFRLIHQSQRPHLSLNELEVVRPDSNMKFPRSVGNQTLYIEDYSDDFPEKAVVQTAVAISDLNFPPNGRSLEDEDEANLEPLDLGFDKLDALSSFLESYDNATKIRRKRQSSSSCSYVETECSPYPTCGVMPLYSFLGQETPMYGHGVFPWTANLYKDGKYLCGATLMHQEWVLIGEGCAVYVKPPYDYVVARVGGYIDAPLSSGHEQLRQVVQITKIAGARGVWLGRLAQPVKLNEYVNVICIPNVAWVPRNRKCVISGRIEGPRPILNYAFETIVKGRCNANPRSDICAREVTTECLEKWSGALACPDGTGRYYAIGTHFTENGGCYEDGDPPPRKFTPLVTRSVREGITKVIKTADDGPGPYANLDDSDCHPDDGLHRCPLGNCIDRSKMCNGFPDCSDTSDENLDLCRSKKPFKCSHLNSTHCECPSVGDMLCKNHVCVSKLDYCDGKDDCGDGSDEPVGCKDDCALDLMTMGNNDKICNGEIDCFSMKDLGGDESAELCCPAQQSYRCMLGQPKIFTGKPDFKQNKVEFSGECLPPQNVCDFDPTTESCASGADESDCTAISGAGDAANGLLPKDAFGRFQSQAQGYLYVVLHGRTFLYCANPNIFNENTKDALGDALCKFENYQGLISIELQGSVEEPQKVDIDFQDPSEEEQFKNCKLVHLVCQKGPHQM